MIQHGRESAQLQPQGHRHRERQGCAPDSRGLDRRREAGGRSADRAALIALLAASIAIASDLVAAACFLRALGRRAPAGWLKAGLVFLVLAAVGAAVMVAN